MRAQYPTAGAAIPLSAATAGATVRIVDIGAGRGFRARLGAMGLLPGAEVKVIRSAIGGPVVVRVKETKLVLGRGMARKILVA